VFQYQKPTIFPSEILAGYIEINAGVFSELPDGLDFKIRNKDSLNTSLDILSSQLGLSKAHIVTANQVHQDTVLLVNEMLEDYTKLECDAIVTQNPAIIPSVRSADCGNILLFDPVTNTRAVIHSGYKGTVLNIVGKSVEFMVNLGVDPSHLLAYVCPSIGQNALWVWQSTGRDCPEEFKIGLGDEILRFAVVDTSVSFRGNREILIESAKISHFVRNDNSAELLEKSSESSKYLNRAQTEIQNFPENEKPGFLIDLNGWIKFQLIEAGLKSENIEVCKINTFEDLRFHSQRRARIIDKSDSFGVGLGLIALR